MLPVIEVINVWKTYRNHVRLGIKERLVGKHNPVEEGRFARTWALQDISFQVEAGRSLGIVGHNGTGKSTLLSLILGTIREERGEIRRRGQIGAMLELGSGFHPDLTGRENIYLNGSILGMRMKEIKREYDSIVSFSELGNAIDRPIRVYSSGMMARLAFSVMSHARRDVLLIDEILAVGDDSFQKKCTAYLNSFVDQGGSLVIVSHDAAAVKRMCTTGIWLNEGRIAACGLMEDVSNAYLRGAAV